MSEPLKTSLFLVPTPIGNLADISLRAIEVLKSVDLILAEDTRVSGFLLKHYEISKPLQSYHNFNEHKSLAAIMEKLKSGQTIAVMSDAGTPGISDPGFLIARECLAHHIKIECLPGATAFVPALLKSGLPADRFVFEGFLPQKKGRMTLLKELSAEKRTMIFYESPYRLVKTLQQFSDVFGPIRKGSVSRELTKKFEETINGTLAELLHYFTSKEVKGEIVIIVEGNHARGKLNEDASNVIESDIETED